MPWSPIYYSDTRGFVNTNTWVPWEGNPSTTSSRMLNTTARFESDLKSPLIKNKSTKGWRHPSDYTRSVEKYQNFLGSQTVWLGRAPGYDNYSLRTGIIGNTTYCGPMDKSIPLFPNTLVRRAEMQAIGKIKSQRVNYAVALAEANKSVAHIASTIDVLIDAYRFARRGRWSRVLRTLRIDRHKWKAPSREFSKRWLEVQYGWTPLLLDVHGAYEDARVGLISYEPRFSVKGKASETISPPKTVTDEYGISYFYTGDAFCGCFVRLDYVLDTDTIRAASSVGLTNPLSVAWELLGFSFVIDWLVPIGDWCDALDANLGVTFKGGTQSSIIKFRRLGKAVKYGTARGDNVVQSIEALGSYEYASLGRIVYRGGPPTPSVYLKNPFSARRGLTSIALLRGLLKG